MKIKIELNDNDVRELIYESFCNGGLQELAYSSIKIDWNDGCNKLNYAEAKGKLQRENPDKQFCYEDILTEMFVDNGVYFRDYEDYSDSKLFHFTFDLAKENLAKALSISDDSQQGDFLSKEIMKVLPVYNDADAITYNNILQTAMYGEVVYA
jgi:hypothetical protein